MEKVQNKEQKKQEIGRNPEQVLMAKTVGNQAWILQMEKGKQENQSTNQTVQCVRILDSANLAQNIRNAAAERQGSDETIEDIGSRARYGDQAHHIIPNEIVVEALDHWGSDLIGESFRNTIAFFDQAWNGIFMGSDEHIPRHTGNHGQYTEVVRQLIGDDWVALVTDESYAMSLAAHLRETLIDYRREGVRDLNDAGAWGATVKEYYMKIGYDYIVHEVYDTLSEDVKEEFRAAYGIHTPRISQGCFRPDLLFHVGVAYRHYQNDEQALRILEDA